MYYVYLIRSERDKRWYTGYTSDLEKRLKEHNLGEVFSTKHKGPFKFIYYEGCLNEYDARARERYLKSGRGKRYLKNRLKRFLSVTGFTIIELIVGLVISSILILAIGAISRASSRGYNNLSKESQFYNDVFYGLNLMKHYVREATSVAVDSTANTLTADNLVFKKNNGADLIYTDTSDNTDHIIVAGVNPLVFTVGCSTGSCLPGDMITVNFDGTKDKRRVTLSTDITRRN